MKYQLDTTFQKEHVYNYTIRYVRLYIKKQIKKYKLQKNKIYSIEDYIHTTYEYAFFYKETYKGDENIIAWLLTIAHHIIYKIYIKQQIHKKYKSDIVKICENWHKPSKNIFDTTIYNNVFDKIENFNSIDQNLIFDKFIIGCNTKYLMNKYNFLNKQQLYKKIHTLKQKIFI